MVYYRKYRPQKISELDLDTVREKLTAILSSKELPHAFLFTGSKGLGKTSAARILAKAINCEARAGGTGQRLSTPTSELSPSIEPCNECEACASITNGSNIDVLEIDAASNGGVEEIRTLRERVKFASSTLRKKVYIIDEVHMLSTGAFNALLKTLEEPPPHVVFILATTELHKLPATIVSRAFQVQFEKPTTEQIARSLQRIVEGEGLVVEGGVLEKISEISDNAFRDAAKNLEELMLASKNEKLTLDLFDSVFRTSGLEEAVAELLVALSFRDAKKGLEIIVSLSNSGADFKIVTSRIVDHLRELLMLRNGIESNATDIKDLNLTNIKELLELSSEAYAELKMSVIPSLPLELMIVKYCILDREEVGDRRAEETEGIRHKTEGRRQETVEIRQEKKNQSPIITSHQSPTTNLLPKLIAELNRINKPGAALLRSAKEAVLSGDSLAILTPFPIHADRLKSENVLSDLKQAAEVIVGKKVEVVISTNVD